MTRSDTKRLNDIRRMCLIVADLVERGRSTVEADEALWLALERAIEIAGEAASHLGAGTRSRFPEAEWRELVAVRVILAHANHRVDLNLLWDIASRDLPSLAKLLGPVAERDEI